VAGFSPDQLQVMVEDNQLIVAGKRDGDGKDGAQAAYLHRGIAARGFMRSFVLAQGMEVDLALLEHGLLHIDVVRPEPARQIKHIPIQAG
jgi:HSP20 family molecular chaperone IbpA